MKNKGVCTIRSPCRVAINKVWYRAGNKHKIEVTVWELASDRWRLYISRNGIERIFYEGLLSPVIKNHTSQQPSKSKEIFQKVMERDNSIEIGHI